MLFIWVSAHFQGRTVSFREAMCIGDEFDLIRQIVCGEYVSSH